MRRLSGIAASDGIALGAAVVLDRRAPRIPRRHVLETEVEAEVARFRQAVFSADQQLQRIKEKIYWAGGEEHTLILQAHQLILQDEQLVERTVRFIREDQLNAEWALTRTVAAIKQLFDKVQDDYFRERRTDVDLVANHLLQIMVGDRQEPETVPPGAIVVAHDLAPADVVRLHRARVRGFASDEGGRNAHAAIIARSLGIPFVVGLRSATAVVGAGDQVIVDGYRGAVVVCPDEETLGRYRRRMRRRMETFSLLRRERELPAETLDGVQVQLLANVELPDEIPHALALGAEGIGLYRTEFLYLGRARLPSEEEHLADALQVLDLVQGLPVTFRTCDLGLDKMPDGDDMGGEANPALGLRSLRLCLARPQVFRVQLRGLLRAAAQRGSMRLMFPMVSGVDELRQAKAIVEECRSELEREGQTIPAVAVGVMIEMPSAALTADILAREADFFSIGTNDLTQYVLATDRGNQQVHHLFRPSHPAVLRLIRQVVKSAEAASIPVGVCGEMAGDPLLALLLLGLGIRQLSMSALSLPAVKQIIRHCSGAEATELAQRLLELGTPAEVEAELERHARGLAAGQLAALGADWDEDTLH